MASYGSSKAAVSHLTRNTAFDLGPMGIRANAISAGPVNTVSARGVSGFTDILKIYPERAPLHRNIDQEDVGKAALFLLSDLASGVTGEVLHVDAGFHITAF